MSNLEQRTEVFNEEVTKLVIRLEEIGEEACDINDHLWDAALNEMGYVEDHGPDIDGIASSLIEQCAGHLGVSPQQFAWWGRKYNWIAPRYTELDAMISDVINCNYNAWLITYHQKNSVFYKDLWEGFYEQDEAA